MDVAAPNEVSEQLGVKVETIASKAPREEMWTCWTRPVRSASI